VITPSDSKRPALLRLFVDGGSRGNPGPAGGGAVLLDEANDVLVGRGFFFGTATNNVAEYKALIRGLDLVEQFHPQRVEIFADSELIVRQITGEYRVKSPDLLPLYQQAQRALLKLDDWQIRHVPRGKNQQADRLANLAMNCKGDVDDAEIGDGAGKAEGKESGESADAAGPAVEVTVSLGCDPRVCPATVMVGETFRFTAVTPAGLCIHAAAAILPAVLAIFARAAAGDPGASGPVRVICPRPQCNACFKLVLDSGD
jgi:uncharacterized repeat protein (TIGR04076 family)